MPGYYRSKPARGSGRKPGGVGNARRKAQRRRRNLVGPYDQLVEQYRRSGRDSFNQSYYNEQFASPQRNTTRRSQARYGTHRRAR